MAIAGKWANLKGVVLSKDIVDVLSNVFGFLSMTPVQAAAIPPLLQSQDVSVDAETGSGKTLSFLIPIAQSLLFGKDRFMHRKPSRRVAAIVILPTRELAFQVHKVATKFFSALPGLVVPCPVIGGDTSPFGDHGTNKTLTEQSDMRLVIATPGRLNAEILSSNMSCAGLEFLILDEADRLLDMGFDVTLTSILSRLPKQRRTGLYSATQTAGVEELARAGLRNPVRIAVRVDTKGSSSQSHMDSSEMDKRRVPASLNSFYLLVSQEQKLGTLCSILALRPNLKFIVYFLTCASVQYHSMLPLNKIMARALRAANSEGDEGDGKTELEDKENREIFTLHGKMPQKKRSRSLAGFSRSANGILLCTDVAARGIDMPDVDCVIQFDTPQDPDVYIHRVGRTARLGRQGSAIIFLMPSEDTYVDFLKVRKCPVSKLIESQSCFFEGPEGLRVLSSLERNGTENSLFENVRATVKEVTLSDRSVLDNSERAFLSFIRGYKEHKCGYILKLDDLDIGSVARSFGLLRLPRFHEFKKLRSKIEFSKDPSVCIREIPYKDRRRESKRQAEIKEAVDNRKTLGNVRKAKPGKNRERTIRKDSDTFSSKKRRRKILSNTAPAEDDESEASDDFGFEAWQLRKVKRGKLSRKDFDALIDHDD